MRGVTASWFKPTILAAVLLAGFAPQAVAEEFTRIPKRESRIDFASEHFSGSEPAFYKRAIPHGVSEYAVFVKGGMQAAIHHVRLSTDYYFPEHRIRDPKESLSMWPNFDGMGLTWGDAGQVVSSLGRVRYQRFEISVEQRACIAFTSAWGASVGEEMGRTRLMSGYFCKPGAEPLTNDQVAALVHKIRIER